MLPFFILLKFIKTAVKQEKIFIFAPEKTINYQVLFYSRFSKLTVEPRTVSFFYSFF